MQNKRPTILLILFLLLLLLPIIVAIISLYFVPKEIQYISINMGR